MKVMRRMEQPKKGKTMRTMKQNHDRALGRFLSFPPRVAKCQGYWGYISVKMFAGWGKKFGRT